MFQVHMNQQNRMWGIVLSWITLWMWFSNRFQGFCFLSSVPEDGPSSMLPGRLPLALALGHQQQLARAATLEQLRERLETGMGAGAVNAGAAALEGPERKMARLAEEQQRLLQQAFQQNLLAMASQVNPANLRMINNTSARGEYCDVFIQTCSVT